MSAKNRIHIQDSIESDFESDEEEDSDEEDYDDQPRKTSFWEMFKMNKNEINSRMVSFSNLVSSFKILVY